MTIERSLSKIKEKKKKAPDRPYSITPTIEHKMIIIFFDLKSVPSVVDQKASTFFLIYIILLNFSIEALESGMLSAISNGKISNVDAVLYFSTINDDLKFFHKTFFLCSSHSFKPISDGFVQNFIIHLAPSNLNLKIFKLDINYMRKCTATKIHNN